MYDFDNQYLWIVLIVVTVILLISIAFISKKRRDKARDNRHDLNEFINETIANAGYAYDDKQDIFYSRKDAWQKKYGYCQLYDEATAPFGMIIDCEPIRFEYGNKKWLIEFWKGQYGMTMGCEVGVYYSDGPDLSIPGVFNGTFYEAVEQHDELYLAFILRKNRKVVFKRQGKHWWLTGFKLGEFAEPYQLTMDVAVTLKDKAMRNAFIFALKQLGYGHRQMRIIQNTVWIFFDEPYSEQPYTRIEKTDQLTQRKNQLLCETYQALTRGYETTAEKLYAIKQRAPELLEGLIMMGKPLQIFKGYELIKNHLIKL